MHACAAANDEFGFRRKAEGSVNGPGIEFARSALGSPGNSGPSVRMASARDAYAPKRVRKHQDPAAIVVGDEEGLEVRPLDLELGAAIRSSQKTNRDLFVGDQHIRQPCVYSRSNDGNFLETSGSKNTLGYL
jgi:hypothetical protein